MKSKLVTIQLTEEQCEQISLALKAREDYLTDEATTAAGQAYQSTGDQRKYFRRKMKGYRCTKALVDKTWQALYHTVMAHRTVGPMPPLAGVDRLEKRKSKKS